ncbi:PH-like domain-containing protein [Agromyces sp. CCNWLW203]|uniref:PH-like domain-containing protein n=1 Tax=Agromyces sp. CCNWLW203 TaxID=3112842 RepID=UPI002F969D68
MDKVIGAVVAIAVVALVGWLMYRSWKRRTKRDESLGSYPVPAEHGAPTVDAEVLYVATTPLGEPLERLAVHGLAFRGSGHVEVLPEGVILRIAGESLTFIPADRLVGAQLASYAIDRGVEPEGLVALTWIAQERGTTEPVEPRVDSYVRARYPGDPARIVQAVNDIAAAPAAPRSEHDIAAAPTALRPEQESEASHD